MNRAQSVPTPTHSPTPSEQTEAPAVDKSRQRVRAMFAAIAPRYDLLNHLLSLNIDKRWRTRAVKQLRLSPGVPVLDCCTGSGDLALELDRQARQSIPIVGADFCRPLLNEAAKKIRRRSADGRITLVEADAMTLPFPDNTFGAVTVAFGLRNIADTRLGLSEMVRVTRPGGQVAVLEFSRPRGAILGRGYWLFFKQILPRIGQAIAPNPQSAYHYLPASVLQFPDGSEFLDLMTSCGLAQVSQTPYTRGVASLYLGQKP